MADKINLFELDLNIDSLTTNTGKVIREIKTLEETQKSLKKTTSDLQKEINSYNGLMKEAKKSNDPQTYNELKTAQQELKVQYEEASVAMAKNATKLKSSRQEYNLGTKLIDAYTEKQRLSLGIVSQTDGSIDQLSAALANNRDVYRSLSREERETTAIGGKLLKLIQEQDAEYKNLNKGIGVNQVEVGNYKDSIKQAFTEMNFFNGGLQSLVSKIPVVGTQLGQMTGQLEKYVVTQRASALTTSGTSKSLKLFKIALISTGIGAIVVLLGSLVAAFMSTQKGMDAVTRTTKPLQVIFQRLWGILQGLATAMVETFTHPKKAISDLWEFIKTNLVNRVTGLIDTFKFVGKTIQAALNLDFEAVKENAGKVAESVTQTITGVDELGQKITNAAKQTGAFLSDSWKAGQELANLAIRIEEVENEMVVKRSMLNAEYEKQKEIAQDVNKTEAERKAAAQKAIELQNELLDNEQALLDMKIKQKQTENDLNDTSREDQKELNELIAQRTDFEAQAARKRVAAMSIEKTIDREIRTQQVEAAKQAVDAALKESQDRLALFIAENKGKAKTLSDQLAFEQSVHEKSVQQLEAELEAKKISQLEYETRLLELKHEFLQKQTEITINNASKEIDLYIAQNQSKLDADTKLSEESVKIEENRLYSIYQKQKEYIELQHNEGVIGETDFQLQMLELQRGYLEQKKALEQEYKSQTEEERLAAEAKAEEDWQLDMELASLRGENEFDLRQQQLDRQYAQQLENAKKTGADTTKITAIYAEKQKQIEAEKEKAKLNGISDTFGAVAELLGEETTAGKIAAIAQATINTYQAATAAYSAMAAIPVVGPALGAVAAGLAVASGVKSIQKIASTNTKVPKAEKGAMFTIGGRRHSEGGTKFVGEDGTQFEAEKGEKLFVLNRLASRVLAPGLSRLNQITGGRSLWSSSSYLADGGTVSRAVNSQTNVKVEGAGMQIDYDLLATKVADKMSVEIAKLPRPVTDVKDIISEVNNYNDVVDGATV